MSRCDSGETPSGVRVGEKYNEPFGMLGATMVIRFVGGPKDGHEYELPPIDAPLVIRVRSGGVVHVYEFLGDRSGGVERYEYQGEQNDE